MFHDELEAIDRQLSAVRKSFPYRFINGFSVIFRDDMPDPRTPRGKKSFTKKNYVIEKDWKKRRAA